MEAGFYMIWLWISGKEYSSRGNNKYKVFETGACLTNLRNGQEANIGKPMEIERSWR